MARHRRHVAPSPCCPVASPSRSFPSKIGTHTRTYCTNQLPQLPWLHRRTDRRLLSRVQLQRCCLCKHQVPRAGLEVWEQRRPSCPSPRNYSHHSSIACRKSSAKSLSSNPIILATLNSTSASETSSTEPSTPNVQTLKRRTLKHRTSKLPSTERPYPQAPNPQTPQRPSYDHETRSFVPLQDHLNIVRIGTTYIFQHR